MSEALITLSTARDGLSMASLAQESPEQLRARLRAWYHEALAENFIVQIQVLAEMGGVADGPVFTFTDTGNADGIDKPLVIVFNRDKMTVVVTEGRREVCNNTIPSQERLMPGEWIRRVVGLIADAEAVQRAKAERERLGEHHAILSIFADDGN